MKDARLRVRSLVTALVLLLITSFTVRAQEGDGFLSDLHNFRVNNYMALDAYYRFSASGDTETLNEIVASINAANESMNSVADSTAGVLSGEQVESLNVEFDKFKDLMRSNINDVRNTGYPDLRLVSDMANQALSMNQVASEMYAVARESAEVATAQRVEAARSAAVTMAQMMPSTPPAPIPRYRKPSRAPPTTSLLTSRQSSLTPSCHRSPKAVPRAH
ncbi:hypothetical protein [Marinobacter salarius]|uniref:hypothetical protein n=1 Tax=Marinobacter salarius TaxID=1420917 RepID=UPI0032F06E08